MPPWPGDDEADEVRGPWEWAARPDSLESPEVAEFAKNPLLDPSAKGLVCPLRVPLR